MKLIIRESERNLNRRHNEPYSLPFTDWKVCTDTEGLTHAECLTLIHEWAFDGELTQMGETYFRVTDPYCRTEYQIVPDSLQFMDGKFLQPE